MRTALVRRFRPKLPSTGSRSRRLLLIVIERVKQSQKEVVEGESLRMIPWTIWISLKMSKRVCCIRVSLSLTSGPVPVLFPVHSVASKAEGPLNPLSWDPWWVTAFVTH